ncbi:MAG: Fic family protein [Trebonia sp.]
MADRSRNEQAPRRSHQGAASQSHHPLLSSGACILDFIGIHRFIDGNGRMARLLMLLLLYEEGYDVGRLIRIETLLADTRELLRRLAGIDGRVARGHPGRRSMVAGSPRRAHRCIQAVAAAHRSRRRIRLQEKRRGEVRSGLYVGRVHAARHPLRLP